MGANDPYTYYFLWDQGDWNERNAERQKTVESKYFPGVVKWVEELQHTGIIDRIGRVIFFHCDHNGRAFEHRDLDARNGVLGDHQYTPHNNEFIHIRYRTKRGFYIFLFFVAPRHKPLLLERGLLFLCKILQLLKETLCVLMLLLFRCQDYKLR